MHWPKVLGLMTLLSFNSYSQDGGLSIGLGGSYDYHLNTFEENPWYGYDHQFDNLMEFSIGGQIDYKFESSLGIRTGVSYARKGYKLIYAWVTPGGGNGTGDPYIPMESSFKLGYIDIPISVYYDIIKSENYSLSPSIGCLNSISINESEVSLMGDDSFKETSYNSLNTTPYIFAARIGFINNIVINDKWFISLEPYCTYNFERINNTDIESPNFTTGAIVTVNLKLGD